MTGQLTRPPTLLKQVEARFPPSALDAGVGGVVEMELDLGPDGKVADARVVKSAGHDFDEAALEAVRQFEFTPAEVDGQPAAVRILYSYEFFFRPQAVETPVARDVENFAGVLVERGTRKAIEGASVAVGSGEQVQQTTSDAAGRFAFKNVPVGTQPVVVTSQDHQRYEVTEELREGVRTEVTYYVRRKQYGTHETVVRGQKERKEVAQVSLRQEEIRLIPGTQGDALKVVQNLPGVSRSPFSFGLLVVRGGKPWDTRVYVDDTLIPQLFHFGGLYATFNANLLEEISFQPGNFGAEHGRNIAGVVTAATRTPAQDGLHGYVDVNVIDSSLLLEGPAGGDWSVAVAGRRSYVDVVLPAAVGAFYPRANEVLSFTVAPRYYDYQLKAEHRPKNSRDRLSVMFFGSNDEVAFVLPNPAYDPEGRGDIRTLIAYNRLALNWQKQLSSSLRFESFNSVGYDQADLSGGNDIYFYGRQFPIQAREALRLELSERLSVKGGLDLLLLPFRYTTQSPPTFKLNQIPDPFLSRQLQRDEENNVTFEPAAFLEAAWRPLERLKLVGGLRFDAETYMRKTWLNPRAAAFLDLSDSTTLKGAAGLFHQPPDYRIGTLSKKFGNPDLLPEASTHYSVGVEQRFTDAISLDLQLYYKDLFDQVQSTPAPAAGTDDAGAVNLRYTNSGLGRSFGAELLLRHQLTDRFFGWIAYSLSRSERQWADGSYGLHPLDQTHNLIVVGSYKLPGDFIFGARVRYATGPLNTPYVGAIYDANGNYYYPLPGAFFSRRLPDFFQLDVRLDKRFVYERWMLALYLDVQNVTNQRNVEGVFNNYDYSREQYIYGLPILPALGLRGEF